MNHRRSERKKKYRCRKNIRERRKRAISCSDTMSRKKFITKKVLKKIVFKKLAFIRYDNKSIYTSYEINIPTLKGLYKI